MKLVELIKTLFTRKQNKEPQKVEDFKTLETIKVYDDVIIKIDDKFYNGWISGITKNNLIICYDEPNDAFKEIVIPYNRPYNKSIITFNNKTVYLNKYEY